MSFRRECKWAVGADGKDSGSSLCLVLLPQHGTKNFVFSLELIDFLKNAFNHPFCKKCKVEVLKTGN